MGGHGNGGVADGPPGALELVRPSLVGGGAELVGERPHRLARGWTQRKPPKRGEQPLQVLLEDRLLPNLCDMTSPQVERSSSPSGEESVESGHGCPPHRGELPRCRQSRQLGRLRFGCKHTHVEQVAHTRERLMRPDMSGNEEGMLGGRESTNRTSDGRRHTCVKERFDPGRRKTLGPLRPRVDFDLQR